VNMSVLERDTILANRGFIALGWDRNRSLRISRAPYSRELRRIKGVVQGVSHPLISLNLS